MSEQIVRPNPRPEDHGNISQEYAQTVRENVASLRNLARMVAERYAIDTTQENEVVIEQTLNRFLEEHIYDKGTGRDIRLNVNGEWYEEKAVHILQQPAFASLLSQALDARAIAHQKELRGLKVKPFDKELHVYLIDIKNLKGANAVSHEAGDLLINKFARVLYDSKKFVEQIYGSQTQVEIAIGRMGGDEFGVYLRGLSQEDAQRMLEQIIQVLTYEEALYKQNGKIVQRGIEVYVEPIDIPKFSSDPRTEDSYRYRIFREMVETGATPTKEELDNALNFFKTQGQLNTQALNAYLEARAASRHDLTLTSYQPQEAIATVFEKLRSTSPDLMSIYLMALKKDRDNGVNIEEELKKIKENGEFTPEYEESFTYAVLEHIQNNYKDRLLGYVMNFQSFAEELERETCHVVRTFSFPGLKEINDDIGQVQGNIAILNLFEEINKAIAEEDRQKIIFSRRSSTIFIGVRKGCALTEETLTQLSTVTKFAPLAVGDNDHALSVPITQLEFNVLTVPADVRLKELFTKLSAQEALTDLVTFTKLIPSLSPVGLQELEGAPSLNIPSNHNLTNFTLARFLSVKRGEERVQALMDALHDPGLPPEIFKKKDALQELLEACSQKVKDIKERERTKGE